MQRKAVLLGERGGAVAAAIVEGTRLAFLYRAAAPGQPHGAQQARPVLARLTAQEASPGP